VGVIQGRFHQSQYIISNSTLLHTKTLRIIYQAIQTVREAKDSGATPAVTIWTKSKNTKFNSKKCTVFLPNKNFHAIWSDAVVKSRATHDAMQCHARE
jgi:hypothetical protein